MKVIKIGAVWCSGCLIMNKIWNKVLKEYSFEYLELDIDVDEDMVEGYGTFEVLPVFIVFDGEKEITRFSGEYNFDEFVRKLKEVGAIDEKDS